MEKRITIEVPSEFHKKVKMKSIKENSSIKEVTVKLLAKYLKEKEHGNG